MANGCEDFMWLCFLRAGPDRYWAENVGSAAMSIAADADRLELPWMMRDALLANHFGGGQLLGGLVDVSELLDVIDGLFWGVSVELL